MKKLKSVLVFIVGFILIAAFISPGRTEGEWLANTPLSAVLKELGTSMPMHYAADYSPEEAERGREIVEQGFTTSPDGKKSDRVSRYFVCTHCHNTRIEDPDLRISNPDKRLDYVVSQQMPLLPGTTFYGMVNRVSWYNDDYARKYGALVAAARDTLVNAIQLCATECSQGRKLKDWEVRSLLAYFYTLEYKLGDLLITQRELKWLNTAREGNDDTKKQAVTALMSAFYTASPATFIDPSDRSTRQYGVNGNAERGEWVYKYACQWCHAPKRKVTHFELDNERITFRFLKRYMKKNNHFSVYFMVRKGTYAMPGYKPYMPNFTRERMSQQQLEDLIAYINSKAR